MATSSTPTISIYNALRSIGIEDAEAKSTAEAIALRDDLASKLDLERAIASIHERFATLTLDTQERFATLTLDTQREMASIHERFTTLTLDTQREMAGIQAGFQSQFADLKASIKLLTFVYGPIVIALLVRLVFFS